MDQPTVHDVALAAGVSLATVDRVLNQRGGVRPVTVGRVEAAIAALNYRRDAFAVMLAKRQSSHFVFVIPTGVNTFLANLAAEIGRMSELGGNPRVQISIVEVPPFDGEALAHALEYLQQAPLSGVAVVATDHAQVRQAIDRLVGRGVKVVTLVSDVPGSKRLHYVGVDNCAAGRTAASLMGRFLPEKSGSVAVIAGSMLLRDHAERHFGFGQILRTEYPQLALLPVVEGRDNAAIAQDVLSALLNQHPDIVGVYSIGAGNRGIIRALHQQGLAQKIRVIAHELTVHSREALVDGTFDAILNQDAGHEARSALRVLQALSSGQAIDAGQERIRIDVYLRDNLP